LAREDFRNEAVHRSLGSGGLVMSATMNSDVAAAIGHQVEQMIMQAKKDSESRVRHELSVAKSQLQHMNGLIGELGERVVRCAHSADPSTPEPTQTVDHVFLKQQIAQLEQKWGSEVKALKQDLHRTILAHNHNSDLMRHHRDALDDVRRKLDAQTQPMAEQVDVQIEKMDRVLRHGQTKQRAIDVLTVQLTALEQQINELQNATMPGMPPMPGVPGLPPMMTQPPMSAGVGSASTRPASKKAEQPNDEELRARHLAASKAAQGNAAGAAGINFNADAPVFVPRGTPPTSEGDGGAPTKLETAGKPPGLAGTGLTLARVAAETEGGGAEEQSLDATEGAVAAGDSPIMLKEPTPVEVGEVAAQEDSSADPLPPGLSTVTDDPDSGGS